MVAANRVGNAGKSPQIWVMIYQYIQHHLVLGSHISLLTDKSGKGVELYQVLTPRSLCQK
jgi:hypothetical protein